jgi:hypothetical protein
MNGDAVQRDESPRVTTALKLRVAGVMTAGVVISLALAPEALARIAMNHNETVLTLD